jgi:hypothetical protein
VSDPRWRSRPFGADTSARGVIAECLTLRDSYFEQTDPPQIPPGIWSEAGAIVNALRAAGFVLRRTKEARQP